MSNARTVLFSLSHRLGATGSARVRAFRGSGGSKTVPVTLIAVCGALAFTSAPALAAAPEAPTASVEDTTAVVGTPSTEVVLHGVLDPGLVGEPDTYELGEYEFLYNAGSTCTGVGGGVVPAMPGISFGGGHEELPAETLTGLTAGTKYTVCLQFKTAGGTTLSTPVTFTTSVKPEAPKTEAPEKVTATTATFRGEPNPLKAATVGYEFHFNDNGSCEGGTVGGTPPAGLSAGTKVASPVKGLAPNAEYEVCVVAVNEAGETTVGNAVPFKTPVAPPSIESESISPFPANEGDPHPLPANEVRLEGMVNANNEPTECHFQYEVEEEELKTPTTALCEPGALVGTFEQQRVGLNLGGLETDKTYYYRVVAKNGTGTEVGTIEHFKTAFTPEAPAKPAEPEPAVTAVTTSTATLHGVLNPASNHESEPGSSEFVYRQSVTECQREVTETVENPFNHRPEEIHREENEKATPATTPLGATPLGGEKEAVQAPITELLPGAPYTFCLVVRNEAGEETIGPVETFTAKAAQPTFSAEASANENASSADLTAKIDPNGAATTYHFEYDTTPYEPGEGAHGTSIPVPDAPVGAGTTPVLVSQSLTGLTANTEYHWRLVAKNAKGTETGPDHTFNTFVYLASSEPLPDERAYEMVTPVQKNGGLVGDVFTSQSPAIAEGEGPESLHRGPSRLISMDIQCFEPAESCNGNRQIQGEPLEFTRTDDGQQCEPAAPPCWNTTALAPSATEYSENTPWGFNASAGTALFSMPTGKQGEDEWYARLPEPESAGTFTPIGPAAPLGVTGLEPFRVPVKYATADLSHVIWINVEDNTLHEYFGTHNERPFLVGVTGEQGSENLISACETTVGGFSRSESFWDPVSENGRTVYFDAHACEEGTGTNAGKAVRVDELYARVDGETPEAHTVKISAGVSGAEFRGASEDGSKVFFTEGENLYESECFTQCETEIEQRRLIDVSAPEISGESPQVQGVVATSSDGSHVYFVAKGKLTTNKSVLGKEAVEGKDNLYVFDAETHHTAFIALLPGDRAEVNQLWQAGNLANVTPEGRFLVFASHGDLTPDDTRTEGKEHNEGPTQIFRYDAVTGGLVRISSGEDGFDDDGNAGIGEATIAIAEGGGANVGPMRDDPTMSSDGSYVFFQSPIALTPHALNDVVVGHEAEASIIKTAYAENVYEWHEGHVYLISDGHDASAAETPCKARVKAGRDGIESEFFASAVCLLGTDATGHNVFFMTADQLVPKDTDTQVDIYDARICEPEAGSPCITEPPPPSPPCIGEQCHGIPAATPSLLAPGSATFNGEGNLSPAPPPAKKVTKKTVTCKRGYVKKKVKKKELCIKKKTNKKAKKSSHGKGRA